MLSSPAFGDSAAPDPIFMVRLRQLLWLQHIANSPDLVGLAHRIASSTAGGWSEPSLALRSALNAVHWTPSRNTFCLRVSQWPLISPELSYPGPVIQSPVDAFPDPAAVFTDGSISLHGGAAAVPSEELMLSPLLVTIPSPQSSTQCELVAICLALSLSNLRPHRSSPTLSAPCSLSFLGVAFQRPASLPAPTVLKSVSLLPLLVPFLIRLPWRR